MPLVKERGTHPKVRLLDLLKRMAQVDETTIGRGFKYADGANHLQATLGGGPSAKCLVDDDSVRPKFPGQCDSGGFTGVKPLDAFDQYCSARILRQGIGMIFARCLHAYP